MNVPFDRPGENARRRYLVVIDPFLSELDVWRRLRARLGAGPARVHLLVPAARVPSPDGLGGSAPWWSERGAAEQAEHRLARELGRLGSAGARVTGEVVGPDPVKAVLRVLQRARQVDEVLLAVALTEPAHWTQQLARNVWRRFGVPVTHVLDADAGPSAA